MRSNRPARLAALATTAVLLAGCETTSPGGPMAAAPLPPPMTHTRAASECWMSTEKVALKMSLDRRADLVHACIEKKMHGRPA